MRTLIGRGVDHQQEALFGGRELRDVVIRMRTSDMLLHGAIALFLWTSMIRPGEYSGLYFIFLQSFPVELCRIFSLVAVDRWGP